MKFSEQWLREWANPPVSSEELAAQLTMAGLEVDAIEPVAGEFTQVVVGEVLSVTPHPDADRLRVCQVNTGAAQPLTIVCGAANVAQGLRVPTALVGARLPGGLEIKRAKLRGVESSGMLCSAKELGLAETSQGLLILPADAPVGCDIREYLKLNDVSITLGLTPNRGDCLSVLGVAREAAVINNFKFKNIDIQYVKHITSSTFDISIEVPEACPRYLGRIIKGINPQAVTPLWMQERLRRSGLRSISPIVDVTNHVLLELGQPMHAFDLGKLAGGIRVRYATQGERLTLLDGKDLALEGSPLVIADHHKPVALAGIMGGADSAVSGHTRDIFLECAFFAPAAIAGRARRYGLHTDSSHRYERGVDFELPHLAMERATALLLEIVGGEAGPVVDKSSPAHLPVRNAIALRATRLRRLLGIDIAPAQVTEMLTSLGMQAQAEGADWRVTPPSWRFDIAIEADLIEEIARIYGYNRIPARPPMGSLQINTQPESHISDERIRRLLVDRGYQEAITYSFVDPALQAKINPGEAGIALANPIASDMAVMRTTLWTGLLQTLMYNQNRQQSRVRFFEIGTRFLGTLARRREEKVIAGIAGGLSHPEQWGLPQCEMDFYDAKADVEALLGLSGRQTGFSYHPVSHPALHPGQSCEIRDHHGKSIGMTGALHPGLVRDLGITGSVLLFELNLEAIAQAVIPRYQGISRFPWVRRDLAIVVDEGISAREVETCISEAAGSLLRNLQLFDVYRGKGIDSGKKSLALGLTFQDSSRTLTDEEVEALVNKVVERLTGTLGAALRE